TSPMNKQKGNGVVLCSGKVYYDLLQKRRDGGINEVAILRLEQPYACPVKELTALIASYPKAKEGVRCQEEPKNPGSWLAIQHDIRGCLLKDQKLYYAGRDAAAAPAVGKASLHAEQQAQLVQQALIESYK